MMSESIRRIPNGDEGAIIMYSLICVEVGCRMSVQYYLVHHI